MCNHTHSGLKLFVFRNEDVITSLRITDQCPVDTKMAETRQTKKLV